MYLMYLENYMDGDDMNQYQMLYSTPYLYSLEMLRQMYKGNKKEDNMYAIREHMLRHDVYLDRQYRGYYLSQQIEEDLYGDEQDGKGNLSIKPKGWG